MSQLKTNEADSNWVNKAKKTAHRKHDKMANKEEGFASCIRETKLKRSMKIYIYVKE